MLPYFKIFDQLIYTYPLILGLIWSLSFNFLIQYFADRKIPYFKSFLAVIFITSWVSAKLFYILSTDIQSVDKILYNSNFWLGGGFVFFGGLIGGMLVFIAYLKLIQYKASEFKIFVPVLAFSHGIGRIGCFLAGCCFGKACDLPWSIHMHGEDRHPVQLYESLILLLLSYIFYKRVKDRKSVFFEYIFSYSIARFSLEFFRGDKIRGVYLLGLSSSQLVSIALSAVVLMLLIYRRKAAK